MNPFYGLFWPSRFYRKGPRAFTAGLIHMSNLCSSPPPNPPARHPELNERILEKLFSQATLKAVPTGRNLKAPCSSRPSPESPRTCARYPACKAAPHSVGRLSANPHGCSCRRTGAFRFSHELAAACGLFPRDFLRFLRRNTARPSCPPHPDRGSIGLPRPCERTHARGPAWRGRREPGRHGTRAAGLVSGICGM